MTFVLLWTLAEGLQVDKERQSQTSQRILHFALNDLIKFLSSAVIWYARRMHANRDYLPHGGTAREVSGDEQPSNDSPLSPEDSHEFPISRSYHSHREPRPRSILASLSPGSVRSTLSILVIGFVYALRAYVVCSRTDVLPFPWLSY